MTDQFPAKEFDNWADNYDESVANAHEFPFTGYEAVLDKTVELAKPQKGMRVLDLGIGTGNLALKFETFRCDIWGTDFSSRMLEKARLKLPNARLFQLNLSNPWPAELDYRFDRIISAYVFHHFQLNKKVEILINLFQNHLASEGKLIIADIAFQNRAALDAIRQIAADSWEDEYYWLADETISAFAEAGYQVIFHKVSSCAGVFEING